MKILNINEPEFLGGVRTHQILIVTLLAVLVYKNTFAS